MDKNYPIKVAMICHFSDAEIRAHLPLSDSRFYAIVRRLLGMPTKVRSFGDIAPWDTNTISFFRGREDIDLHVISAHSGLKQRVVSFESKGVNYSFISCEVANFLKRIIPDDALWRKLNPMTRVVRRLVNRIRPDIVLLMGAENAYYSSTVLGIDDYPVYTLCQTIYNNPERALYSKVNSKNATTEMEIFKRHRYFGVYCKKHYDLLKSLAPDRYIFKFGYPSKGIILEPTETAKEFDFVNFALSMDLRKGFPDSIRALAIVKNKYPNVRLNLVGGCNSNRKAELDALIEELGLQDNVIFTPFFEKRSDLFLHIQKSRFAVLPCKLDHTSGTMTQSMQLGLPLVVYRTTGTPALNRNKECVLIADKENIEQLAGHMLTLMENPDLGKMLAQNAREYQERKIITASQNGERLMSTIRAVVENYRKGTPIPTELLFNPEIDD